MGFLISEVFILIYIMLDKIGLSKACIDVEEVYGHITASMCPHPCDVSFNLQVCSDAVVGSSQSGKVQ